MIEEPERQDDLQALFVHSSEKQKTRLSRSFMELAGLEPATSWLRSSRPFALKVPLLQRFMAERLECRNISRNSLILAAFQRGVNQRIRSISSRKRTSSSLASPVAPW
jgi:hypothetical protein